MRDVKPASAECEASALRPHLGRSRKLLVDPEADIPESDSDASGDDDAQEDKSASAREHYASVGKSKLRKPKEIALGPQYSGSRVSRDAVDEDDDEDDPFARGFDDEDSEEEDAPAEEEDAEEERAGADSA